MFRKMLKSDLMSKKGLNVILFISITVASILVSAGTCRFCTQITGGRRTAEGELQNSPVDCLKKGNTLQEKAFPDRLFFDS